MSETNTTTIISYLFSSCCHNEYTTDHDEYEENNNEINANLCALKTVMCYSHVSNNVSDLNNKIYNSCECMHTTCDFFAYSIKYIFAALYNYRIEPMHPLWIRVGRLSNNFTYDCNYEYYSIPELQLQRFSNTSESFNLTWYKPWYSMKIVLDHETYILSRINASENITTEKSQIRFISIEYTHPDMEQRVPLEIDTAMYIEGNQIFSVSMVKHLLEHQSEKYVFDMRYTLFLMDNNIEMYELKYDEYILLEKRKINIMNISSYVKNT
jgi:hypothetical protein